MCSPLLLWKGGGGLFPLFIRGQRGKRRRRWNRDRIEMSSFIKRGRDPFCFHYYNALSPCGRRRRPIINRDKNRSPFPPFRNSTVLWHKKTLFRAQFLNSAFALFFAGKRSRQTTASTTYVQLAEPYSKSFFWKSSSKASTE